MGKPAARETRHSSLLFELGEFGFQLRQLRARAREHFALHVEFLARYQVEAAERGLQEHAQVLLEVRGRAAGEDLLHPAVDFLKQARVTHKSVGINLLRFSHRKITGLPQALRGKHNYRTWARRFRVDESAH